MAATRKVGRRRFFIVATQCCNATAAAAIAASLLHDTRQVRSRKHRRSRSYVAIGIVIRRTRVEPEAERVCLQLHAMVTSHP